MHGFDNIPKSISLARFTLMIYPYSFKINVMRDFLAPEEKEILLESHRAERVKKKTYRINTILLLNEGWSYEQIAQALFLDDSTVRRYETKYRSGGLDDLLDDNYAGGVSKLSEEQLSFLKDELKQKIYLSSKAICKFVEREFGVFYSPEGLVHLLHRIGFVYKKTKQVPGKADAEAQEKFLQEVYVKLKASMKADDKLYFLDGVHPQHNSMPAYGWLEKGKTREIRSNSGRQRLNLNGALSLNDYEVVIREDDSINAQSTIKLLAELEAKNPDAETIYCILDNARYYRALIVKEYLKTSKVELVFLPPYSPNLNLIERLWKFYRKKILYHKHYSSLGVFKTVTMDFFKNLSSHRHELATLLTENFEITGRSSSQT